ncbi:MAG: hypothetical protein B6I26_01920 [Desulfobacteraceae bacterium 4572_130]|nr:MAG: hypothetical protein B6I26_01920 [Desulfobacteraceae bacterium 4572_130]
MEKKMKLNNYKSPGPRIEMLALIDVIFLLLIFFIYAMLSMAVHNSLPVNLPDSESLKVKTSKYEKISITIDKLENIYINKNLVSTENLTEKLKKLKKEYPFSNTLLFGDKKVSYEKLFMVMEKIRQAGITKISFQAEAGLD